MTVMLRTRGLAKSSTPHRLVVTQRVWIVETRLMDRARNDADRYALLYLTGREYISMQLFQRLEIGGRIGVKPGYRRVLLAPFGPGVGYRRILVSILIRRFPHRITKMTSTVIAILRWRRCPGDGATHPAFSVERRDQTDRTANGPVSSFRTRQAAIRRHLRGAPRANWDSQTQNDESLVSGGIAA